MKLVCLGDCLAPTIVNGTVIEAESAPAETIRPGELVVFTLKGVHACHRVLYKRKEDVLWWFFLKPDNTGVPDGWIPQYRLVGKVTRVGDEKRPTELSRREDRKRLWKSRLGYAVYRLRKLAHA